MQTRIATDMEKVSRRLDVIVVQRNEEERQTELNQVNANFGMLIEDIAGELQKIASDLKGTVTQEKTNEITASEQNEVVDGASSVAEQMDESPLAANESNKESSSTEGDMLKLNSAGDDDQNTAQILNEAAKEDLLAESSSSTSSNESNGTMFSLPKTSQRMKKKKLKKRKTKKNFTAADSTDYTTSDDSNFEKAKNELNSQSEQSIAPARNGEMCTDDANKNGEIENGIAVPANLDADSDFFGFENSNEAELGIKSEITSQQSQLKQPSLSLMSQNEVTENNDGNVQNVQSTAESLQEGDEINSLSDSESGGAEDADSDDDDDDIRK